MTNILTPEIQDVGLFFSKFSDAVVPIIILSAALITGILLLLLLFGLLIGYARRTNKPALEEIVRKVRSPALFLLPVLTVLILLQTMGVPDSIIPVLRHVMVITIIVFIAWLLLRIIHGIVSLMMQRYDISVQDNLKARTIITQVTIIQRIVGVSIIIVSAAAILMTFETIRQIGVGLLASAGVIGIIIGFAAQKTIAMVLAGIQIALTQPVKIDDVVIIEGEWGRIEEITLTYLVVRIWDLRRLVVPITYVIENPIQNWTRSSANLLGTVYVYADYRVPVDILRKQLRSILEKTDLWDTQVCGLVVTNLKEETVELRALMSAENSSKLWDLRCLVREELLTYIQKYHADCLPRSRIEITKMQESSRQ